MRLNWVCRRAFDDESTASREARGTAASLGDDNNPSDGDEDATLLVLPRLTQSLPSGRPRTVEYLDSVSFGLARMSSA